MQTILLSRSESEITYFIRQTPFLPGGIPAWEESEVLEAGTLESLSDLLQLQSAWNIAVVHWADWDD